MRNAWFDSQLSRNSFTWLVTGAAGFIGSHLMQGLLSRGQKVVGLDNYSTGSKDNFKDIQKSLTVDQWDNFQLFEGDICNLEDCKNAVKNVNYVLHHAALGSVPYSIMEPSVSHAVNSTGFLNMLIAARDEKVKKFVYASSCAVYGDNPALPLAESAELRPLSPYAAHKASNELYAHSFARSYGMDCVGLRYFNVFGERQDPKGAYAAVIPNWIDALVRSKNISIFGDGHQTRDFVYVGDVVRANIASALYTGDSPSAIFNIGSGRSITLNQLYELLIEALSTLTSVKSLPLTYERARMGDIMHSSSITGLSDKVLSYSAYDLKSGLLQAMNWYLNNLK